MKKIFYAMGVCLCATQLAFGQLVSTSTGSASFFSKTPVEDIDAHTGKMLAVMNLKTNEMAFSITNTTFEFPNKLMQEHFNEKYIESETYPTSTFKGKINEQVDLTKDGEYTVTATGKLTIHGVEQERTISGKVLVKGGVVTIKTTFTVKVADHKIEIPKLVIEKVAEEISVTIDAVLNPKK
jgi:polyisoprenoid-binding protein YceI